MQVIWTNGKDKAPTVCEIKWASSTRMLTVRSKTGVLLSYSSLEKLRECVEEYGRGKVLDGFTIEQ